MSFKLFNASIVVLMRHPAVGTFTPQYFRSQRLFGDRVLEAQLQVPVVAQYRFEGGLVFEAVDSRVKVENTVPQEPTEQQEQAHVAALAELAEPLYNGIEYMSPNAVGLNFHFVDTDLTDLSPFISSASPEFEVRTLVIRKTLDSRQYNLSIGLQELEGAGPRVVVESNAHFALTEGGPSATHVIRSMPDILASLREEVVSAAQNHV